MPVERKLGRMERGLERTFERERRGKLEGKARKQPLSVERIVDAALDVVAAEGFEALTMRRVAAALDTGPASLYAHVVNKADLDELMIGRLCSRIDVPAPDPHGWREQIRDLCAQVRDQYLKYPGVSRAALGVVPSNLQTLRISEGMLAIMLAGGVEPQTAAWGIDALSLYVNAYCLEVSMWLEHVDEASGGWGVLHETLLRRFADLPDSEFPETRRYAEQLTAGAGHDRFDFALQVMLDGLAGPARRTRRPR